MGTTMPMITFGGGLRIAPRAEDAPDLPPPPPEPYVLPALTDLGTPIIASRLWTDALAPRNGGGWNWIGQFYNAPEKHVTEWVVMHLDGDDAGDFTIDNDNPYVANKQGHYANQNFDIKHQIRAPNGRIFFPAVSAWNYYYDPTDERVHDLGRIPNMNGVTVVDANAYSMVFNEDGSKVYGGTIAAGTSDKRPCVFSINTTTLAVTTMCRVGSGGHSQNGYAYYLWADGDYLYALVGQDIWDIVSVHIPTNTQTVLLTKTVRPWMMFTEKPEGVTVDVYKDKGLPAQELIKYWLVDGVLYDYTAGYDPEELPFTPRDVTPYVNTIVEPPQIDESQCPRIVSWREFESVGAWTDMPFTIVYTTPIPIESLLTLPDGAVLGNVQQYQGFFRHDPDEVTTISYGPFEGVSEGNARLVKTDHVFISGYPNGALWKYTHASAWSNVTVKNPISLGSYSNGSSHSGVKRANVLAYGATQNRLYMAGLRDRNGVGAGVGWYDFDTLTFGGHYTNLNFYIGHLGLVVFDTLGVIVFGGQIGDDPLFPGETPDAAELVLHNLSMTELERVVPIPGIQDTGKLYHSGEATVLIGLSMAGKVVYRWDVVTKLLLSSVDLTSYGTVGVIMQATDYSLVAVLGTTLVRINPSTLVVTDLGTVSASISCMTQSGDDLYVSIGTSLGKYVGVFEE